MLTKYTLKCTFFLPILLCSSLIFSQQNEKATNKFANYNKALELYSKKAYAPAQKYFDEVTKLKKAGTNLKADAAYYEALCAIKLNQADADAKVLNFVENYPTSNKRDKALFNVGNYYFNNRKPAYALKWYQRVNAEYLSSDLQNELTFKTAYALLASKKLDQAKSKFSSLLNNAKYGNDSRYYYGYISYKQEDFQIAQSTLKPLEKNATYKKEVTYYLLDISFREGKFKESIDVGLKLLDKKKISKKDKSEISKIVGESYFNLEKYKEAIPYLEAYKGRNGKWNNTDYYQVGFAYFKQKDYKNAIRYFNRILGEKNYISQKAYYNLGECYLYLDKKSEALNAFKSASEMSFDAKVQEDAFLNYAKLSYEEGNPYKSVAEVLQDFLKKYPKSSAYNEINSLIVNSFVLEENYKGALDYLAKNSSAENKRLAKEISYYRAIQLFNKENFTESLPFFTQAKNASNKEIKSKATYWNAEANYRLGNFKKALINYNQFLKLSLNTEKRNLTYYNLGYTHFKLKNYNQAAENFERFLTTDVNELEMKDDARIRLGDSYYAVRNFNNAINAYKKVASNLGVGGDYAQFQIGMSYGLLNKYEEKIAALTELTNNFEISNFKDDALFQIGNTYALTKNNNKAHQAYERLLSKHPKSLYNPQALLRNGLLYYSDNESDKALKNYKEIVAKYQNSEEAKQAVKNARNVYVDIGKVEEYASWVKTISFANVTNADLDNATYESAENYFIENKASKAIEGFRKYLTNFPQGLHTLKANFYLAQLLVKTNQKMEAIPYYQAVLAQDQSEYSEEALNKLSLIYLQNNEWQNAIPILERLELEANFPQNILFAQSNLMKGYYQQFQYDKALTYAEKVLQTDKIENQVEYDAKIIIARSAYKQEDIKKAKEFYTEVEENATGELKAEALYYKAYFKNLEKKYLESNKIIQTITSNFSAYKYWGAKSFVIMAKNYYAIENKDPYQATYILENIIKNFSEYTDIVKEAKTELTRIKENEAKTNISVNPKN